MISIRSLSDSELILKLKHSVAEERKLTALVLDFLREVDRRKLYAEFGCSSLWDFCIRELGYSEASASRRIASMRLIRELPELKEDLVSGKQTLSNLAAAQKFFRIEKEHRELSLEEKRQVLEKIENKTSRECERELLKISSAPIEISRPEKIRALDEEHSELKLVLDQELLSKLKRLQELRSHANPKMSYTELLNYLADEALKRIDPEKKSKSAPTPPPAPEVPQSKPTANRLPISAPVRREVWRRDQGHCTWKHPQTGKSCGSRTFLEIDHITPVALSGGNELSNLRLRCWAHNAREAVKVFGASAAE